MDDTQARRVERAREVLTEQASPADSAQLVMAQAETIGRLRFWLAEMVLLADELDVFGDKRMSPSERANLLDGAAESALEDGARALIEGTTPGQRRVREILKADERGAAIAESMAANEHGTDWGQA